jgi:regulator of replication initiation timing
LGQTDFEDAFSESEALRVENRRLRIRLDELVYENASLKEKSEA